MMSVADMGPEGIGRAASEAAAADLRMPREIAGAGIRLAPIDEAVHRLGFEAYFADPASRFTAGPGDGALAWKRMAMWAGQWRLLGFGHYAILDERDHFCGHIGVWFPIEKPEIELVYGLVPDARGKGIARRAVELVRDAADACGIASLVSYIAPANGASQNVAAAVGAVHNGNIMLRGVEHQVWRHTIKGRGERAGGPIMVDSAAMPLMISTERLSLVHWRPDHFEVYAAHEADAEAQQFVGGPEDRSEAWRILCAKAGQWALRGTGMYAVEHDGDLVGHVGLYDVVGWPERELGWHTYRGHTGKGYAREAAAAVLAVCAEQGLDRLVSHIHPDNAASRAVARALGAAADGDVMLPVGPAKRVRHDLSAPRNTVIDRSATGAPLSAGFAA